MFVTSDWHLGGSSDFYVNGELTCIGTSICRSVEALTEFIDWVTRKAATGEFDGITELVVNGDMVDFLAPDEGYEPQRWLGDQEAARKRFLEIVKQSKGPEHRGPFEAMRDLLAAGCELTILLGNHDIELSLPAVRNALEEILDVRNGWFRFIYDGEACIRGRLLIEHGNRYDPLNVVDFSRLRQERSHLSRGLSCKDEERGDNFFLPPFGSTLVADVTNNLLPNAPYLNLLKPEIEAALPLVLALVPESRKPLQLAATITKIIRARYANRLKTPAQPLAPGYIAPGESDTYRSLEEVLQDLLGPDAEAFLMTDEAAWGAFDPGEGLWMALKYLTTWGRDLAGQLIPSDTLGILASASDNIRRERLQIALRKAQEASTFALETEEPGYLNAANELMNDGGSDVVVFGHTHCPKRVNEDGGLYLNCGTWADTLKLPVEFSESDDNVAAKAMLTFLEDMNSLKIEPYLHRCLSFVEAIIDEDGTVSADVLQFNGSSTDPTPVEEEK